MSEILGNSCLSPCIFVVFITCVIYNRHALDLAKIPYKHKVRNQDSEWLFQGKGTKRSQFGSIEVDQDKAYEYEILVRKEDKARAEHEII